MEQAQEVKNIEDMTLKQIKELIKNHGNKKIILQILEYLIEDKSQIFYIKRLVKMIFNIDLEV